MILKNQGVARTRSTLNILVIFYWNFLLRNSSKKWPTYSGYSLSEEATNSCKISTVHLWYVVTVKSTVEILQSFVAFSEYMNFTYLSPYVKDPIQYICHKIQQPIPKSRNLYIYICAISLDFLQLIYIVVRLGTLITYLNCGCWKK